MELATDTADIGEVELLSLLKVGVDPFIRCGWAFLLFLACPSWDQDLLLSCLLAMVTEIFKWVFKRCIPCVLRVRVHTKLALSATLQVSFARVLSLPDVLLRQTGASGTKSAAVRPL